MASPILLSAERVSGGRVRWVVSVAPGQRVTIVSDGVPDTEAHAALILSGIIPALHRGLPRPEGDQ